MYLIRASAKCWYELQLQKTHLRSLIRICTGAFLIAEDAKLTMRSDHGSGTDLNLLWALMSKGMFSPVVAYIFKSNY